MRKTLFYLLPACLIFAGAIAYLIPGPRVINNISYDKDAAQHDPADNYFIEWWNFDGTIDENLSFILTVAMASDGNLVDLLLYDSRKNKPYWYRYNFSENDTEASKERCWVRMGNNIISEEEGIYTVSLKNKDLFFEYKLTPLTRGPGHIMRFPLKGRSVWYWIIAVPRGKIEGRLKFEGRQIDFSSLGSHDHDYFPQRSYFAPYKISYYWGRFFTKNYTLIMYQLLQPNGESRIYIFKDNRLIRTVSKNHLLLSKEDADKAAHGELPGEINLKLDKINLSILTKGIARKTSNFTDIVNKIKVKTSEGKTEVIEEGGGLSEIFY